jgi:hypothetical protein
MKFFHLSNSAHTATIPPTVGASRHEGEDRRAIGKAVVWLSNEPMTRSDHPAYQYEVDLDPNDPLLCEDEPFKQLTAQANAVFGKNSALGWFFYFGDVPITTRRTWDQTLGKYV